MKKIFKQLFPLAGLMVIIGIGCRKQDQIVINPNALSNSSEADAQNGANRFDSYIPQTWYNLTMKLIVETPGHTPPIAARSFGYTGITLYEALLGQMANHHSLVGQLNGLTSVPPRKYGNSYYATVVANAALARIIKDLFQNASIANLNRIDSLESVNEQLYSGQMSQKIISRSRDYGYAVADAIFDWSRTDGGDQAYLNNFPPDYIPPVGIDKWIPTPPLYLSAMLPYWGKNRTMVSTNDAGPIDPPPPPAFSTSPGTQFYDAAYEVYNTGTHLSPEQSIIALYWADGTGTFTPSGHNIAITLQIIRNRNLNLNQTAIILAKVGIALNDAAIVCWRTKYNVNLLRPVTFIKTYIDSSWMPLIATPPFPSYTSGHSSFSGATAKILTAEIGDQIPFTDSSKISSGFLPRSFNNFNQYAKEAAISRLYAGIHYHFDNKKGFSCGQQVAMNVEHLNW